MECWNLTKNDYDDFITYTGVVNWMCENFKLQDFTQDMFESLTFVQGFITTKDKYLGKHSLKNREKNKDLTPQIIAEECWAMVNLKQDMKNIQEKDSAKIQICWLEGTTN